MQLPGNIDWMRLGYDAIAIVSALLIAKLLQFILLKLLLRFGKWFHWQLNEKLEAYCSRPLLFLLIFCCLDVAINFTSLHDIWIARIQIIIRIFSTACLGWLVINITHAAADWLRNSYITQHSRDLSGTRRLTTQIHLITRVITAIIVAFTCIGIAVVIPGMRKFGVSLFASAGVASLVIGMAANSTLSNLFAGIQIAITQPILLGDEIVINNTLAGTIDEIKTSYVVVKLSNFRRLIVPLNYFMSNAFENRTYTTAALDGSFTFELDYSVDIDALRADLQKIVDASDKWDHKVCTLQVADCKGKTMEFKVSLSACSSSDLADLQSEVREKLIIPLQKKQMAKA